MLNTYRLGDDGLLQFHAGDDRRPPRSGDRVEDADGRPLGVLAFRWRAPYAAPLVRIAEAKAEAMSHAL